MIGSLEGKTALVTGASGGIGRAIALCLARAGAFVVVHYATGREAARKTVAQIAAAGGQVFALGADIRRLDEIERFYADVDEGFARAGVGPKLDILVNNAGAGGGGSIGQIDAAALDRLIDTNIKGTFFITQKALERFADGGRIITISSMVTMAAYPHSIAYALTKAAMNSFTRSLAADLGGRHITVNAVAPGATRSEFIAKLLADPELTRFYEHAAALGRLGEPDDIASVVGFLASAQGGWITGQVIQASGGMHL